MHYLKGRRPSGAMIVAIIALIAACTGGAYAAATIGSKDIKNDSIRGKDVRDGALKTKDLSNKAQSELQGQRGARGPQGPAGQDGADGADGEDGQDGADGADGADGQDVGPTEFGVARVYKNNTALNASWTSDIPDDGNNAAQTAGTLVTACQGGDTFTIEATIRSDEQDGGQAGAGIVVTNQDGSLLAAGQTAPSSEFPGTSVVDVPNVPKNSAEPTGADDTELVSVTIPDGAASSQCTVDGTGQFFDFDDSNGTEG